MDLLGRGSRDGYLCLWDRAWTGVAPLFGGSSVILLDLGWRIRAEEVIVVFLGTSGKPERTDHQGQCEK